MRKLAFSLTILMLFLPPAVAGTMYLEGPNERGEGPAPPATGMTIDTLGLFFVDIYAEDMPGFAGFQTTLEFLDSTLADAAGSSIFMAYNHMIPQAGAPFGDRPITWNQEAFPGLEPIDGGVGLGPPEEWEPWLPFPINDWGDYIDYTITDKTWLMTVGYWYIPGAEGDGTETYTIGADEATTTFADGDAHSIPFTVVTGSVTISTDPPAVRILAVRSTPIAGVSIAGNKPGTTNYAVICDEQEVVNLTAPSTVTVGPVRYDLVRWILNGIDQPASQTQVQITVDGQTTATAAYAVRAHTLTVLSTPINGLAVGGDKPGTTDYIATCDDQEVVGLTAPSSATAAPAHYDFVRWIVDGTDQPAGQAQVQVTVSSDITATAVYAVWTHNLTVKSMPMNGVGIAGAKPGTTPYSAIGDDYQLVTLTAPATIPGGSGGARRFLYWLVDGEAQSPGQEELQLTMDAAHTATAIYDWRLDGDNNEDCVVNILDLLHVRHRLNTRCVE